MHKDKEPNITNQKFLRFTDSKEEYGKYEITPGVSGLPSLVIPKEVLKQYIPKRYMRDVLVLRIL